jgi:hypothetical protein
MHSGNGTSVQMGNLGLAESTPTNTEIAINQNTATTHCSLWRGGFLIITTQSLTCPRARKKDPSSLRRFISDNFERRRNGCVFMVNLHRE